MALNSNQHCAMGERTCMALEGEENVSFYVEFRHLKNNNLHQHTAGRVRLLIESSMPMPSWRQTKKYSPFSQSHSFHLHYEEG